MIKNIQNTVKKSFNWFKDKLTKKQDKIVYKSKPTIGKMYLYKYSAKHKETLPYYDAQPLILCLDIQSNYFIGINLHYLPVKLREILLNRLLDLTTGQDDKRKLKISYAILKSASRFKYFKPALKKYLFSYMKSKFIEIPYEEWTNAITLPTANWKNASANTVYKDTLRKL